MGAQVAEEGWAEQVEIRLLGQGVVRRRDGSVVAAREWRTAKNLELVQLLALSRGEPVSVEVLADRLWPRSQADKAQASLRAAAYHVRRILGDDVLARRPAGLLLQHTWVDLHRYEELAVEVESARRHGNHPRVVALARAAEALYVGDVDADSSGDWLREARRRWQELRETVLLSWAEAAVALGRMGEATDLAVSAWELDPTSERAARVMMRAQGALGEVGKALRAYERLREQLADRYGVDPAPQTRALHLQLLTSTAGVVAAGRRASGVLVGHESAQLMLTGLLRRARGHGRPAQPPLSRPSVIWILGEPGSGRRTVVGAAAERAEASIRGSLPRKQDGAGAPPGEVLLHPELTEVGPEVLEAVQAWAAASGMAVVVPVRRLVDGAAECARERGHAVVAVEPLDREEVSTLLRLVLQGVPSGRLVDEVSRRTGGRSGEVCTLAREWLSQGRILWTPDGMVLDTTTRRVALLSGPPARVLRSVGPFDEATVDVLAVLAVVATPLRAPEVATVAAALRPGRPVDVDTVVTRLVDRGLVQPSSDGYLMRRGEDRADVLAWLRPPVVRRLHAVVALELNLTSDERTRHLAASGQNGQLSRGAVAVPA